MLSFNKSNHIVVFNENVIRITRLGITVTVDYAVDENITVSEFTKLVNKFISADNDMFRLMAGLDDQNVE